MRAGRQPRAQVSRSIGRDTCTLTIDHLTFTLSEHETIELARSTLRVLEALARDRRTRDRQAHQEQTEP